MISDTIGKIYDTRFAFVCQAPSRKKTDFFVGGENGGWSSVGWGCGCISVDTECSTSSGENNFHGKLLSPPSPASGKALAVSGCSGCEKSGVLSAGDEPAAFSLCSCFVRAHSEPSPEQETRLCLRHGRWLVRYPMFQLRTRMRLKCGFFLKTRPFHTPAVRVHYP